MTLFDEIQLLDPVLVNTQDFQAIADALSVGRVTVQSTVGGVGTIMDVLGPDAGAAFLDTLESMSASVPAVKWGMKLINTGAFDFGMASSRGMIDQLVPDPDANAALKGVAERASPVTAAQVEIAMKTDNGTWRI